MVLHLTDETAHRSMYHSVEAKLVPPLASRRTFFTRSSTGFPLSLAIVRLHSTNPDLLNTDTWSSILEQVPRLPVLGCNTTLCHVRRSSWSQVSSSLVKVWSSLVLVSLGLVLRKLVSASQGQRSGRAERGLAVCKSGEGWYLDGSGVQRFKHFFCTYVLSASYRVRCSLEMTPIPGRRMPL